MLTRRQLLQLGAAATVTSTAGLILPRPTKTTGGWSQSAAEESRKVAVQQKVDWQASDFQKDIAGTGRNRVIRLWKLWERVAGRPFSPHFQELGDCVAHATCLGCETESAVSIATGEDFEWTGKLSTEAMYIIGRIEVGQGFLGMAEGMAGFWAAEAVCEYGLLPRKDYGNGFNVSVYNPKVALDRAYCREKRPGEGVPAELEQEMIKRRMRRVVRMDGGWDQAADFVANGYPVLICSKMGYRDKPDKDGIILPGDDEWNHSMLLWGIDTHSRRKAGCLANSWGATWPLAGSSHKYQTPSGCFWADARNIDAMLSERHNDSYALIEYDGPKKKDLRYIFQRRV